MRWAWCGLSLCLSLAQLKGLEGRVTDASVSKDSRQTILLDEAFVYASSQIIQKIEGTHMHMSPACT